MNAKKLIETLSVPEYADFQVKFRSLRSQPNEKVPIGSADYILVDKDQKVITLCEDWY